MPLNSTIYIVFLAVTSLFYWGLSQKWRLPALALFGFIFYAYYSVLYVLLLLLLAALTYCIGAWIQRGEKRQGLVLGVGILVLILAYFKYADAFGHVLGEYAGRPFRLASVVLPLGISFYSFEFIHYLIEVYRGNIRDSDWRTFWAFVFFFPTRASGPIKRYPDFAKQVEDLRFKPEHLFYGIGLIVLGFVQKIIIADSLVSATQVLVNPSSLHGAFDALGRLYFYSIRIYGDFMGLTNIAMGSGLLFGILVPRNFNYPYLRPNIALFWNNWHMSLSNWVRDYLYIPFGGSRKGPVRTALNLLMAMLIVGLWHGSTLNFAVWGLYHGVGLMVHRIWRGIFGKFIPNNVFTYALGVLITFHFVTIGWAFFVTGSFTDSVSLLRLLLHV